MKCWFALHFEKLAVPLAIFGIGLYHNLLGVDNPTTSRAFGGLVLSIFGATACAAAPVVAWRVVAMLAALLFAMNSPVGGMVLPLYFAFAGRRFITLLTATTVFEIFLAIRSCASISAWLTAPIVWLSALIGQSMGPTVAGTFLWIWAQAVLGTLAVSDLRRPTLLQLLAIEGTLAVYWIVRVNAEAGGLLDSQWISAAVLSITVTWFWLLRRPSETPLWPRARTAVLAAATALGLILCLWPRDGAWRDGRVLIYKKGFFSMDRPRDGVYGKELAAGPYLGCLAHYLQACGISVHVFEGPLDQEALKGVQVVLFENLSVTPKLEETAALYAFMEAGGSCLVVGDHTNVFGVMDHSNAVTARAGIRLNFDSSMPEDKGEVWGDDLEWFRSPATDGVRDAREIETGIGASLAVSGLVRPLVIGRRGFSDTGDPSKQYGVGNFQLDRGERRGDLVLMAEADVGSGRLVVLGDTMLLQNDQMARTWPFVGRLFEHLFRASAGNSLILTGSLALALVAALLVKFPQQAPVVALLLSAAAVPLSIQPSRAGDRLTPRGPIATVDLSHFPRAYSSVREKDSFEGLAWNFTRSGLLPMFRRDWAVGGDVMFLPAAGRAYSHIEVGELTQFMEGGGHVIVAAGYSDWDGVRPLLEAHHISITPMPLGHAPEAQAWRPELKPTFHEAWAIRAEGAMPLVRVWDHPVAVYRRVGKGGLAIFADTHFFTNKNLEGYDAVKMENVALFKALVQEEFAR